MPVHRLKTDIKIIYRFSRQINSDRIIVFDHDQVYESQIVATVE